MNPTIKIRQVEMEQLQQFWRRHRGLDSDNQITSKLALLQSFITQLRSTASGLQELSNRTRCFGDCRRHPGEEIDRYYGRLRVWLDRELG